jgi:hypothetical protein
MCVCLCVSVSVCLSLSLSLSLSLYGAGWTEVKEIVLKAQIHAGGRGKGVFSSGLKGGVHLTQEYDERTDHALTHKSNNMHTYTHTQASAYPHRHMHSLACFRTLSHTYRHRDRHRHPRTLIHLSACRQSKEGGGSEQADAGVPPGHQADAPRRRRSQEGPFSLLRVLAHATGGPAGQDVRVCMAAPAPRRLSRAKGHAAHAARDALHGRVPSVGPCGTFAYARLGNL